MTNTNTKYRKNGLAIAIAFLATWLLIIGGVWYLHTIFFAKMIQFDSNNGSSMIITTTTGSPSLIMYDEAGVARLDLSLSETGEPLIRLRSPTGADIVAIDSLANGGKPRLTLRDPETNEILWSTTQMITPTLP